MPDTVFVGVMEASRKSMGSVYFSNLSLEAREMPVSATPAAVAIRQNAPVIAMIAGGAVRLSGWGANFDFDLIGMDGRTLLSGRNLRDQAFIPTANLPSGVFIARLQCEQGVFSRQLTVMNR